MITQMDRLTIYCVLCFIAFCSIVLRNVDDLTIFSLVGLIAAAIGLWLELSHSPELEEEES
ncbi:hypothetical protein [Photobacterium sp. 1_MG-2023]|uniref:hypothetical protein n=1 Tax=Photobacterium sp. 1_MG-2023 TaxID=3062646 RepID=UPI0026E11D75|nr:hypothetical protein [Photobacterium sp. 1_MG-2023]MDO6707682.1 hypothetical protein [Photobacterium sp. 1_MG-2023]